MLRKYKFKNIIALILSLCLLCAVTVQAADYYTPGPTEYELDRTRVVSQSGVTRDGNKLVFSAGGSICFDHLMPFESENMVLSYEGVEEAVNLTISTEDYTYTCTVAPETKTCNVAVSEAYGSKHITFSADKAITITGILFQKIKEMPAEYFKKIPEMDEYETALLTTVAFAENSTVLKNRLGIQRLDIDTLNAIPQNIEGSLYVPLQSLAVALKLYCEDYADKSYILLRDVNNELALIGGKGYAVDAKGNKEELDLNVFYRDGITWVPIRRVAESFGFHVEYRDGVVVIGDRICAKNVVENDSIFGKLKTELQAYAPLTTGKTYHVAKSATASDSNSGTEAYPFATLEKASAVAKAGDTVIIHEGTYRETFRPQNSGTKTAPIVFRSAEGEKVVISALEPVSKFVPYKDNIYCASIPTDLGSGRNQLFYNGSGLEEGRHPNTDTSTAPAIYDWPEDVPELYMPTKGDISIKEENGNIATSDIDLNQEEEDYWKGGTFVTLKGYGWSVSSGDIVGSSKGQLVVADHEGQRSYGLGLVVGSTFAEQGLMWGKYYANVKPNDFGYITNHINTIDIPGEWHMEDGILYLYPPVGADLTKDFEIKQRQLVVDLRERQYIVLKDINTIGGGLTMYGDTEGNVLNGGSHRFISHYTKYIDQMAGLIEANVSRSEPNAPHKGEVGFFVGGENNAIVNATIDYSAAAGIYATGRYHYFENNTVSNTSYTGTYISGICLRKDNMETNGGGHTVVKNTSYNAGRAVMQIGGGDAYGDSINPMFPSEIAYNRFYNGSLMTRDTGITYEYGAYQGTDAIRTTMHHNIVYNLVHSDPESQHMTFGIYHDGRIAGRETYNNIVFYQDPNAPIKTGIFVNRPHTEARTYANSDLTYFPQGIEGLSAGDYPGTKPFYAGSDHDGRERFMDNYNVISKGLTTLSYPERVDETAESRKYVFEDVAIKGDCYNRLTFYFDRPLNATDKNFTVKAKVSGTADSYENETTVVYDKIFYIDTLGEGYIILPPMTDGNYNIELELADKTTDIFSLSIAETTEEYKNASDNTVIYGGTWDEAVMKTPGQQELGKFINYTLPMIKSGGWNGMCYTWDNRAIFKDRVITEDANAIEMSFETGYEYSGQRLKIYVDSMNSEPILDTVLEGDGWLTTYKTVPLSRTLEKGTHTFYFDFCSSTKCSNFLYFKFFNDSTQGGTAE